MKKGILCVVDFSESSRHALGWAVGLAQELDCNLTILYTYRFLSPYSGEVTEMKKKIEEEAERKFSALEKELLIGKGISYNFRMEVGFIADRAKDHVKKNGTDLLVVGKKMESIGKQSLDELVAELQMPLVIVP
jgi:nucleotide-binding universal stress UspA family protein